MVPSKFDLILLSDRVLFITYYPVSITVFQGLAFCREIYGRIRALLPSAEILCCFCDVGISCFHWFVSY